MEFEILRRKYPKFIYSNYNIFEDDEKIYIEYKFEIENLTKFNPKIEILKKKFKFKNIKSNIVKKIVFNIGIIEAISYFKTTCSPQFVIKCGKLDDFQIKWFKKLIYLGLGEFRFKNNIKISEEDFFEIISEGDFIKVDNQKNNFNGIIIPIGGGKDSNVTMDLLKDYKEDTLIFRIGNKDVPTECAKVAGFDNDKIIEINRIIDKNLLDLNSKGFLNGHTPFSAIVAFISYLTAYLLDKKYIALSNEDSANESNVIGDNINHQYSKTFEFENDFREYAQKYFKLDIEYFSMLRPINELQVAMIFSKLEKYHNVFNSCNIGSKEKTWKWCCNCPKCLFVFIILSPFLYKEKLINIFKIDLFEDKKLKQTFLELCGYGTTKPFECVGTYDEVRFAISRTIENIEKDKENLPFLLQYYKDNFGLVNGDLLHYYNENNNIPEKFEKIFKNQIFNR